MRLSRLIPRIFFCVGCTSLSRTPLCVPCKEALYWNDSILESPTHHLAGIAPLLISFERGQRLIRRWKENRGHSLTRELFQFTPGLREKLLQLQLLAIVPIPQDRSRSYQRGHDSALEVARFFSYTLGIPILPALELHSRPTPRQTGLDRFGREYSKNPFQISRKFDRSSSILQTTKDPRIRDREVRILLVDDLITSGSTLAKASATLQEIIPTARCWAGALGYRPRMSNGLASRSRSSPDRLLPLPAPTIQNEARSVPWPGSGRKRP